MTHPALVRLSARNRRSALVRCTTLALGLSCGLGNWGLGLALSSCAQTPPQTGNLTVAQTLAQIPAPTSNPPRVTPSSTSPSSAAPSSSPAPGSPAPGINLGEPGKPLRPQAATQINPRIGIDDQLWGRQTPADKAALLNSLSHSLRYLDTTAAEEAYGNYGMGITRDRVRRSVRRFRDLVRWSRSPEELSASVRREFVFYQSLGNDGKGTVKFTGYFEPTYQASRSRTAEYRYPLYRLPPDLAQWPTPHPTRQDLEGADALQGGKGKIKGLELVWLRDRLEAFLVQVQGSARLQLPDGSTMSVGYAGRTNYDYVSVGKELVQDGIIPQEKLTLPRMQDYFRRNPAALNQYLPRNPRFVFFKETQGAAATGSIAVPVTAERSIATDKSLMPPGGLALIYTQIPFANGQGGFENRWVSRYVLDQDTGGAIRGPGRVDIFMGTGAIAGDRAGLINSGGQLFYLLLKDGF